MNNKYLILVNPSHPLADESLFNILKYDSKYAPDRYLEEKSIIAFDKLKAFVKEKGYIIDLESGYRSKELQQNIWDETLEKYGLEHTQKYVAVPGYSEHQSGLAADFLLYENGNWYEDLKMDGHPFLKLVKDNCYKFGFIIRYPKGKEAITGYNYEPWHLRYIDDIDKAKYIMDNNLCLEEYLENKGE